MGWWIPLRSIWRNRRRTVLSIGIIALGTAVSFFVLGFVESSRRLIQESTVHEYGNLQIASPDLWSGAPDSYDRLIPPDAVARIEGALAEEPTLVGSTIQLQFPGLLARGERTQVVRVTGIVPGNGVLEFNDLVFAGRGLSPDDSAAILVGRSLAEKLALSPGDAITLTLTTVDGAYNASPFTVAGIFRFTSEAFEQQVVFLPLAYAQRLLNTAGVDRVIASLSSLEATNPARARLQSALRDASLAVDVKTWDELSPFYRQLSLYFNALFGFLSAAVSILVFFIILQVLTLAFLERTREIGTLRAIGTTRAQVFSAVSYRERLVGRPWERGGGRDRNPSWRGLQCCWDRVEASRHGGAGAVGRAVGSGDGGRAVRRERGGDAPLRAVSVDRGGKAPRGRRAAGGVGGRRGTEARTAQRLPKPAADGVQLGRHRRRHGDLPLPARFPRGDATVDGALTGLRERSCPGRRSEAV